MRWLALVAIIAPMTALAQPAGTPGPSSEEARARLERGLRLYDTQRYAEAIEEFQRGYEIDPFPEFLFAIGQARRLSGDCPAAILAFEAFLRSSPPERQASAATELIVQCRAAKPEPRPRAPAPVPQSPPRSTVAKAPDREPDGVQPIASDRPRRDIASPILGGIGGAAGIAATVFEVSAYRKYRTLRDTCAPPNGIGCTEDQISSVSWRAKTGVGLYIGAGVVGVAAIVAYVWQRRSPQGNTITPTPTGIAFRF